MGLIQRPKTARCIAGIMNKERESHQSNYRAGSISSTSNNIIAKRSNYFVIIEPKLSSTALTSLRQQLGSRIIYFTIYTIYDQYDYNGTIQLSPRLLFYLET